MPREDTLVLRDLNEFSSRYVNVINNRGAQSRHTFVNYYFSCENASVKTKQLFACVDGCKAAANVTEFHYIQKEGFKEIGNTAYL